MHRLTQKTDVVVYKITVKDSVEERILALQEKKRELASQAIEGGAKGGAGKLGMNEILQLFRRDAEFVAPDPRDGAPSYTTYPVGGVLQGREGGGEGSAGTARRVTPPVRGPKRVVQEHPVYGRR